jgi:ATP-dependent Clp protease ATP-binding subunit ClpC
VPRFELTTRVLIRELASGDALAVLAAEPKLASFGDEEDALLAVRLYLTERLGQAAPEEVARFALPDGAHLHFTDVLVPRLDLPRRCAIETPLRVTSLVLPALPDARGRHRAWIVVVPLAHTFFLDEGEDIDGAVAHEVVRLASARGLTAPAYRELLPWPEERLVPLVVSVARGADGPEGTLAKSRKAAAEHEAKKEALRVLESIAEPLHRAFGTPRPFPLRERELALVSALLGGSARTSVLLLGPEQVGKTGLLRAYFEAEQAAGRARFVFRTSGARLVAGMSGFGQWQERVRRVMEAAHRLDAVLWLDDMADLFADRPTGNIDLPSALRPYLDDGKVRVVGELRDDALDHLEAMNAGFLACFARVRLEALGSREGERVLTELAGEDARRQKPAPNENEGPHQGPSLTKGAIAAVVELSSRFYPYECFPGKAVRLAEELRAARRMALGSEAAGATISASDVAAWFSVRTGVPPLLLHDDRALRVEQTMAALRARVVGQDDAVRRVAELVSVVKTGLGPTGKPLATLLFVGPTGVGKTELARALAELLYGGEGRLVRFDMSEYADPAAGERLFLGGVSGLGLLTRRVREQPFGVVLLDEIEKAHFTVFDVLLQVTGEGRLTDGRGRTTSFENAIVIMTSNLGAAHRDAYVGFDRTSRSDDDHYAKVVREAFRPEFVNRIDRVVAFSALTEAEHREIARMVVRRAGRRRGLAGRGVELAVDADALGHLSRAGRSDAYGARALRRHVERALVAPLARLLSARAGDIDGATLNVSHGNAHGSRTLEESGPERERGSRTLEESGPERERGSRTLEESGPERERGSRTLDFAVVPAPAKRSHRAADALSFVMSIRREADRERELDRVAQMCDQADYLLVELGYGGDRKKKKERRSGAELAALQEEHHRLAAIRDALDAALADIVAAEQLALTEFLAGGSASGEPIEALCAPAEAARAKFREALARALVAEETDRDAAMLRVTEIDEHRAFDVWLAPLLRDLERRKWRGVAHVDGGERDASWPKDRRWGPPRSAAWVEEKLAQTERPFRSLLLAVEGDHAGVWLALEAGLHRFSGFRADGRRAHLQATLVARRTYVSHDEWTDSRLHPPVPLTYDALAKQRPVRDHDASESTVVVPGGARVHVPPGEYWSRLEQVALEHLLFLERASTGEREAQLRPLFAQDELRRVRDEVRRRNVIMAIKLYRELKGVSLVQAKEAVEAMQLEMAR